MPKPPTTTPPITAARPPKPREWPKGSLTKIRDWAASGLSEKAIARKLRMTPSAFSRVKSADDRVCAAVDEGRAANEQHHWERLAHPEQFVTLDPVQSPGPWATLVKARQLAALSALNAKHGWRSEVPADGGKIAVTINLPSPAKPDDYRARVITIAKDSENA